MKTECSIQNSSCRHFDDGNYFLELAILRMVQYSGMSGT